MDASVVSSDAEAERLRFFADQSPDWEYWLGPDGRFMYVTPACEGICGHPPEAFIADADLMARLIHPDDQQIWQDHAMLGTTLDSAHGHANIELRIRDREGAWRWVEHCCNALFDADGRYLGRRGVNRDISRRKQAEGDLANLSAVYRTLRAVYQVLIRAEDEVDMLNEVCRLCVDLGGASACVISIGTEGSEELYPITFHGLDQKTVDEMPLHTSRGRGHIPPTTVWLNSAAACCPDCRDPGNDDLWATWAARAGIASCCHYPLRRGGRQYGLVSLLSEHKAFFQAVMLELFQEFANDLGHALDDFDTRYRAEQSQYSLRQREAHLRALLDGAPVGIGVLINRNFVEVNERFCAMLGYQAEEIVGESARMIYASEGEFQRVGKEKYEQITKYGRGQVRTRMRRRNGDVLDVFLSSIALDRNDLSKGVVFTALDITEARYFEEALRQTESRYRLIAENSGDVISVHDMHGACRFVTPACQRVVGRTQEELIGRVGFLDIHEDDVERVRALYMDVLAGGDPGPHEYRLRRPDGSLVWLESTASLIMGIDDTEVLVISRDISARKSVEADLAERQGRYRQLVEHMSDGVAVYQASHDGADFIITDFNRAGERIAGCRATR
jgi:PAS domain S-box-containing protein